MNEGSRWQRRSRSARDPEPVAAGASAAKPPIILGLRPSVPLSCEQEGSLSQTQSDGSSGAPHPDSQYGPGANRQMTEKPIVVLRSRDENRSSSVSPGPAPAGGLVGDSNVAHPSHPSPSSHLSHAGAYPAPGQRHGSASQPNLDGSKSRLGAPPEMKQSIKVIDENFRWIDAGIDELVDQTDYLVVGVIGLQGAGKSTILSMLAGNCPQDAYRNYVFQPQVKETREDALHQTVGVDLFATPERILILDTQPALSSAVLDVTIRMEKKYSQEFSSPENFVEMQSLQVMSFLMTVCHVILVVQDWFTDLTFLRSLLTAEMLKPQTHLSPTNLEGPQGSSNQEDNPEFYPTVVFVLNKAGQEEFTPETYTDMKLTLNTIFRSSKLHYKGTVNMHKDNIISALKAKGEGVDANVNLFLLPTMEYYKNEPESILTMLPEYRGFPSFGFLLRSLRNQVMSVPRLPMTPSLLSERNWFHFAARTWEAVKKSQLIAEYNRLLP